MTSPESTPSVVIIGAGPAGLTAAYELSKYGTGCTVLEADNTVGGIARTVEYKGYRFDIGGHRFFTKVSLVEEMWKEVLGGEFLLRPRLSRIYYKSKFFQYPLEPLNALLGLGIFESARCAISFALAKVFPEKPEDNLEAWVSNRFGKRLFNIFFKSYTEKVWGIPCRQIGAEWAAQRIRGLSVLALLTTALKRTRKQNKQQVIKTLLHEFHYPRLGPGMMWEKTREIIESRNSRVVMNAPVDKISWVPGRVTSIRAGGQEYTGSHFISSMPIRQLIEALDPAPPEYVRRAAADFKYRDFLTVALVCKGKDLFPDTWLYSLVPRVKVGRIQNFGNWSPDMVPDVDMSCLGLEYFCFEGDNLWNAPDEELKELARREVAHLGLVPVEAVCDGSVVRMPKAYPVYDDTYQRGLAAIRDFLKTVPNLQLVGRNGMHRYNNQDHSMLTAVLAARNVHGGSYDLWQVNVDEEYSEEGAEVSDEHLLKTLQSTQPLVPRAIGASAVTGKVE